MPVAIVTGAAKRIGREISLALARDGFDLALHYLASAGEADSLATEIAALGRRAETFRADLADLDAVDAMMAAIAASFGSADLLVNNAARFVYDNPEKIDFGELDRHFRTNLVAPVALARKFVDMATPDALCVSILDNKLFHPNPDYFSYSLSKAALHSASQMMAMHFGHRVRFCGVAPAITLVSGGQGEANFGQTRAINFTGRACEPADVANAILYLFRNPVINGETIVLDGGQKLMNLPRDVAFAGVTRP